MARPRVKPEDRKNAAGAPCTLDEQAWIKMGHDLIKWAENAPQGSYFKDFILDTPYNKDQVNHAEHACPEFARLLHLAKATLSRGWRQLGTEKNNGFIAKMMPLVDPDYKEWRMQELKLAALAAQDPKAALDEIMGKSQSPIKE